MTDDRYVPTAAGMAVAAMVNHGEEQRRLYAELTADTRDMVAAMRKSVRDGEWVADELTPEKVEECAAHIEAVLPIRTEVDARRLALRLRQVFGDGPMERTRPRG